MNKLCWNLSYLHEILILEKYSKHILKVGPLQNFASLSFIFHDLRNFCSWPSGKKSSFRLEVSEEKVWYSMTLPHSFVLLVIRKGVATFFIRDSMAKSALPYFLTMSGFRYLNSPGWAGKIHVNIFPKENMPVHGPGTRIRDLTTPSPPS